MESIDNGWRGNEELETRDGLGFACWDGDLAIWGKPEERDG